MDLTAERLRSIHEAWCRAAIAAFGEFARAA